MMGSRFNPSIEEMIRVRRELMVAGIPPTHKELAKYFRVHHYTVSKWMCPKVREK